MQSGDAQQRGAPCHPGLLKLFFSELADDDAFRALAREQAAAHRATLARYKWFERRYGDRPEYARRILPLRPGFAMEHGLIAFWDEVAEESSAPDPDASTHA